MKRFYKCYIISFMNKLKKLIKDPLIIPKIIFLNRNTKNMSDERYLRKYYYYRTGLKLDLDNPERFNEKMQWLKLHDRKDVYTEMADKFSVKEIVCKRAGAKYVIPLLGVWSSPEEIDYDNLPGSFVLKTTHDCGGVVVCKDKNSFDRRKAAEFLRSHLENDYYETCREWPYKNIPPRIIAEKYMKDTDKDYLPVYKFFCFNGIPKIIQVIQNDKQPDESIDYYDRNWNFLDLRQNFPNSSEHLPRPQKLDEMLDIAELLADGKNFIRVDLYVINGYVYFSEFTFFSDAGFERFYPDEWDYTLGKWIDL